VVVACQRRARVTISEISVFAFALVIRSVERGVEGIGTKSSNAAGIGITVIASGKTIIMTRYTGGRHMGTVDPRCIDVISSGYQSV